MSEQVVEQSIKLPAGSAALAAGIQKLVVAVVANHKAAAGNVIAEVSADVASAVAALGPALQGVGMLGAEVPADPIGVAEAFAVAGCEVAKSLVGSPSAAQS